MYKLNLFYWVSVSCRPSCLSPSCVRFFLSLSVVWAVPIFRARILVAEWVLSQTFEKLTWYRTHLHFRVCLGWESRWHQVFHFFWGIVQSAASPLSLRTIMGVIIAINICIMVVETDVAGHNIFQHWHDTCAFLVNWVQCFGCEKIGDPEVLPTELRLMQVATQNTMLRPSWIAPRGVPQSFGSRLAIHGWGRFNHPVDDEIHIEIVNHSAFRNNFCFLGHDANLLV